MIITENLSYRINGKTLIKDINLKIEDKKFVAIIGPNGSGKSTILRCIYRANKNYTGNIIIDGKNLQHIKVRDSAKKLAVMSQINDMNFDFTVYEMVMLGRSPHKKFMERDNKHDKEIVQAAIKMVGMEGKEDRFLSSLSGGERQRVQLARAFCQESEILILDEPTNHLDIKYQLELLKLVRDSKKTAVAALHDINLSLMFCDYLYCLKDSQLIAQGTPEEIITDEMIYKLYGVKSQVTTTDDGIKNIIWKI